MPSVSTPEPTDQLPEPISGSVYEWLLHAAIHDLVLRRTGKEETGQNRQGGRKSVRFLLCEQEKNRSFRRTTPIGRTHSDLSRRVLRFWTDACTIRAKPLSGPAENQVRAMGVLI